MLCFITTEVAGVIWNGTVLFCLMTINHWEWGGREPAYVLWPADTDLYLCVCVCACVRVFLNVTENWFVFKVGPCRCIAAKTEPDVTSPTGLLFWSFEFGIFGGRHGCFLQPEHWVVGRHMATLPGNNPTYLVTADRYMKSCFWKHFRREISNVATRYWSIFDQFCLVLQANCDY